MLCYKTATKCKELMHNLQTFSNSCSSRKVPGKQNKLSFWSLRFINDHFRKTERIAYFLWPWGKSTVVNEADSLPFPSWQQPTEGSSHSCLNCSLVILCIRKLWKPQSFSNYLYIIPLYCCLSRQHSISSTLFSLPFFLSFSLLIPWLDYTVRQDMLMN